MLSAASLLLSNKSFMEDLELLNSEWDTINALVFLINDVRHGYRDKLTLLTTAQCVWGSVCVWKRWTDTDTVREGDRFRLQAAFKSVYSLRWALGGQLYSSLSLPLHYCRSGHTLFSLPSLSPQGPIEPLTNTLTYLNSPTDPWSVYLLFIALLCTWFLFSLCSFESFWISLLTIFLSSTDFLKCQSLFYFNYTCVFVWEVLLGFPKTPLQYV